MTPEDEKKRGLIWWGGGKDPGVPAGALRSMDNQDECGLAMRAQLQPKDLSEDSVSRRTEMAHAAFGEESQKTS